MDTQQSGVEGFLELVLITPCRLDLLDELRRSRGFGLIRASRCKVLPEERVVDVTTSVEFDALLYGDLRGDVGGGNSLGLGLEKPVQIGDVRLVVFAVVELHDLGGDVRLQRL